VKEYTRQALLAVATAAVSAVVLLPLFIVLRLLLDAGLAVMLPVVVLVGLTLGYLLYQETSR
jgi:hypothetical protein